MANEMHVERIFEPRLVINGDNRYIAMIGASNVNYIISQQLLYHNQH